jgi:alpha-N-arabinofuranosidase
MTLDRPATLWLQLVSLFPPAYHGRTNGNRIDIMEKLAAMKPAFLRFPGGNYLEGGRIETRFDWKKMIGPLVDRPTHPTTWSYHSSDGMGLLNSELCEDLKWSQCSASTGYSLGGQVVSGRISSRTVGDSMGIGYVTGGADTSGGQYAQERASGTVQAALRRDRQRGQFRPPENMRPGPTRSLQGDQVEVSTYNHRHHAGEGDDARSWTTTTIREQGMFEEARHYDKTNRNGPKIFVASGHARRVADSNFGAALGGAACDRHGRNSDVVIMSAYASCS